MRKARNGRAMNSVSKQRFPFNFNEKPSQKTLLMIQMAKDFGFNAYWAGDRPEFGELPSWQYDLIENLVDSGWKKLLGKKEGKKYD